MHGSTAILLLRHLAEGRLLTTRMTWFEVPRFPQPVHLSDVREAFVAVADTAGHGAGEMQFSNNHGVEVYCPERLFEKLFRAIFVREKLYPAERPGNVAGAAAPLPTLFVGTEKTQFRQVPLVETKPWPFRFLLELGGMVVCRPHDVRDFLLELRQFLNNHPQFSVKVDAKRWPDGSIAVFTYYFEVVARNEKRRNVNVPG